MRKYCALCGIEVDFTVAWEQSYVEAMEQSHVEAMGQSYVVAREQSHVVAREQSHVEAMGQSHVEAMGQSHVVAMEQSHVEAREQSHVVARGQSHVVAWEQSHVQCRSPYACVILKSITAKCIGRHIGDKPITPKEYLVACGVEIKNQFVTLYKSVRTDQISFHEPGLKYDIGKETIALDWDAESKDECGKGLHLSPTVGQARSFNDAGTYLACRVKLQDMASLPAYAKYPDKIRARACTPLYRVDEDGIKLEKGGLNQTH